jgi:TonB family protein
MKRLSAVCCAAILGAVGVGAAGAQALAPTGANSGATSQGDVRVDADANGLEVLSDTRGVDFKPYLNGILKQIYGRWVTLMPDEARPPENKQGVTAIRVTISPDGTIAAMHLEKLSTEQALNRAAWGAITGVGKFPALPAEFHGPNLELRIHFRVNG